MIELSKPEELEPATDEEEKLQAVTSDDTNSGETKIIQYFTVDDYNYFSGQSGSENTEHIKVDTDIGFSGASDKKSASAITSSSPVTRWGTTEGGDN